MLLCTASQKMGNATSILKFYLQVMKQGEMIKFIDEQKMRSFMLKKQ
jgi:hypothetical protein